MKHIQWFPGHMTKSMRMIQESAKLIDGVIYVSDARAPFSCINKKLSELFPNKPIIYALNKSDLVEREDIKRLQSKLKQDGKIALPVIGTDKKSVLGVLGAIKEQLKEKIERNTLKGNKPIRISVIGIPNTGKSTFINSLCAQKKAITGDKAGVTRSTQWIKIDGVELMDTPGTMPPQFENQEIAKRLAYIGSLNDDILDKEEICLELIKTLVEICPQKLADKYKVDTTQEGLQIYEQICKNRGFLIRGGDFDYTRCANALLDDFRKGRIGKICLE